MPGEFGHGKLKPEESDGDRYSMPEDIEKKLKSKFPDFNIDLSKGEDIPNMPSFGDSGSYSIRSTDKARHTPLMEILGGVKNPLLKMMVQENYSNSKWYTPDEKYYSVYKYQKEPGLDSVKIKPVTPSKGFIPVLSTMKGAEFSAPGVLEFPELGVFYTDFELQDYYEIFYTKPVPDRNLLINADVYDTTAYNMENMDSITGLAGSIVYGIDNSYMKIEAIEKYLKDNYTLDKSKGQTHRYDDAVMTFLFDTRKGTQLDFVSAFVILLRCSGIQARMATGYKADPKANYQILYSDQLCVFPEVNFKTYGWVALDIFTGSYSYNPPTDTKTEITELNAVAKKGEGFTVKGTVTDSKGKPVDGLSVLIYLKKTKEEDCLSYFKGSVTNGKFEITCPVQNSINVGNYQVVARALANDKYRESWSDPELKVVTETSLDVSAPEFVLNGRNFNIKGSLYETPSNKIVQQEVDVNFSDGINAKDVSPIKNTGDKFNKTFRLNISKGRRDGKDYLFFGKYHGIFDIQFKGTDFYLPSSSKGEFDVWVIFWWRIVLVALSLLIGICIVIIFLGKRKHPVIPAADSGSFNFTDVFHENMQTPEIIEQNTLKISFPQIKNPFPNVWGIGETLTVRFSDELLNRDELNLRFDKKGEKRISASQYGGKSDKVSESIRIVCYSEEVISLGKTLFSELYRGYNLQGEKMTPREIACAVDGKFDQASCDVLYKIVSLFEKATYSMEEIGREEYEKFYMLFVKFKTQRNDFQELLKSNSKIG